MVEIKLTDTTDWSEYKIQREYVKWFRAEYEPLEMCLRLSLNGVNVPAGPKGYRMLNAFKASGMVKGESDLLHCLPSRGYHGFFIEFKAHGKKPTDIQIKYIDFMNELGYKAIYCDSLDKAKLAFLDYYVPRET